MKTEEKLLILKQKYLPEYKDKTFENEISFEIWLKQMTAKKIQFKDNGQDCLVWYIDNGGEVLHSELQAFVWDSKIVDLSRLKVNRPIGILDIKKMKTILLDFIVEKIIDLKGGKHE